jgi:hypothetical protein
VIPPHFLIHLPILLLAGIVAGFLNAVAGGASLVTFPLLVFLGLEAPVANATNNLGTTILGVQAFAQYSRRGVRNFDLTLRLAVPSFLGAIVGAYGVIALPKELFTRIVAVLMLVALVVVLYNPQRRAKEPGALHARPGGWRTAAGQVTFLLLGAYGGFFGGGIGMVILPVLVYFFDQDFLTGNGVKTGVVAVMNLTAAVIFLYAGLVRFLYALPLTVGMIIGGWIGVHWAVKGGDRYIRPFLIVVTLAASIKFLFFP